MKFFFHLVIIIFIPINLFLHGCKARLFNSNTAHSVKTHSEQKSYSLAQYAQDCMDHLGPPPQVTNCSEGSEIQIWKSKNEPVTSADYTQALETGGLTCENPAQVLRGPRGCLPSSRFGLSEGISPKNEKVQWAYLCRQTEVIRPPNSPIIDERGLIGYNTVTGATCFFPGKEVKISQDGKVEKGEAGLNIPPPPHEEHYSLPVRHCTRCHSNYAFISSPWIRGAKTTAKKDVLPSRLKDAPYFPVSMEKLKSVAAYPGQWEPKHLVEGGGKCTTCHRVGNADYCSRLVPLAFGFFNDSIADLGFGEAETSQWYWESLMGTKNVANLLTVKDEKFPLATGWHLPQIAKNLELFEKKGYLESYQSVRKCCLEPESKGCKWEPLTQLTPK